MEIMEQLQEIFRDIFDDESIILKPEMSAKDIEDWDSLAQIQLVVAAERKWGVKFTTDEVIKLKNVGDFAALIEMRIGN
ncbi:MAG TPA: acyl carrier protein [Bacteroidales bacterium]|nr:acyl carrier protein [Bacteroidales bacterium]